jgi:restriction system protein
LAKISKERIGQYLKTALQILEEHGDQLPSKEVLRQLESQLDLTEYEKDRYEKTGYVRWESILQFYSIDVTKAGWLRKNNGVWYLTPEGKAELKLPPLKFIETATEKYKQWKALSKVEPDEIVTENNGSLDSTDEIPETIILYGQALGDARQELKRFVLAKNPYEFQDLVAALLRGMGYHTPFTAPPGKDGGLDITAYKDPFGAEAPRIRVQVKHREQKATNQEVNQLIGILHEGDIGLFVSSSGFTSEAMTVFRTSHKHVEKMDLDYFLLLWERYYVKMSDEDKRLMPLKQVYFLAPSEE